MRRFIQIVSRVPRVGILRFVLESGRSVLGLVGSCRVDGLACWDFAVRVGAPSGSC